MRPSGPSSKLATSCEVGMQVTTTSASRAASAGVAACRAPNSFAKSAARDAVRFQTVRGRPDPATRAAIGRPIAPSPRKAMFMRQNLSSAYLSRMITTVTVEGMTCQHCVRAVFTALAAVPGIDRAEVSHWVGAGRARRERHGRADARGDRGCGIRRHRRDNEPSGPADRLRAGRTNSDLCKATTLVVADAYTIPLRARISFNARQQAPKGCPRVVALPMLPPPNATST